MEVEKQCMICGKNLASGSCEMCGRLVCKGHIDKENGICLWCKQGIRA